MFTDEKLLQLCKNSGEGLLLIGFQGSHEDRNVFDVSVVVPGNRSIRAHVQRGTLNSFVSKLLGVEPFFRGVVVDCDAPDIARRIAEHVGHDLHVIGDCELHVRPTEK